MRRYQGWLCIISLALTAWGCNKSEQPRQDTAPIACDNQVQNAPTVAEKTPAAVPDTPEASVKAFLEAIRTGNDERASAMISSVARQKTAALTGSITPPASDTARFSVGKVEYIGADGARVASVWTDVDEDGQAHSDEAVWVLRKEAEGWRVAGVAAMIFPGEEPLLLNFEDPDDMKRKQEEVRNRMNHAPEIGAKENLQAEQKNPSDSSMKR
jgi:hypothetical protein